MTTENNKAIMNRFVGFFNTANEKLATELISPNATFYGPGSPEPMRGIGMMRSGFPDIQWTLEEMVTEGDKIAACYSMRGTHLGAFFSACQLEKHFRSKSWLSIGYRIINSLRNMAFLRCFHSFSK